MRFRSLLIGAMVLGFSAALALAAEEKKVLVYTRNGLTLEGKKGYVHDNIKASVEMIRKLGKENGYGVDVSDEAKVFTLENLKQYKALIFSNANNEVFDTEQQKKALQDYIHGGGGFVGIHSSSACMRNWTWFHQLVGGAFEHHAPLQKFTIKVVDRKHPSTSFLGETWQWQDEFYFHNKLEKDLHVVLSGDLTTVKDKKKPKTADNTYPLAWYHEFEGGRSWFTALGHKIAYYSDKDFQKHVLGGILWAMGETKSEAKEKK